MKPRLLKKDAFHVVGMRGQFTPQSISQISSMWGKFAPQMHTVPGRVNPMTCYGVCAAATGADGKPCLEYTACVEVGALREVPRGMVGFTVPAANYAVFTHTGPITKIGETWDAIHHEWLRAAGLSKQGALDFERYDERWDPKTGMGPVDIYIPVAGPS